MATNTTLQAEETLVREEVNGARPPGIGASEPPERRGKPVVKFALVGVLLVVAIGSILLYRYYSQWESTDNAQIDGYVYPISARVPGHVARVAVDDNQFVEAGAVLVELDPRDYEVAVANAQASHAFDKASANAMATSVPITSVSTSSQLSTASADVESARAGLAAAQQHYDVAQALLRQAEANDQKAQDDLARYKLLVAKDEISQQMFTTAINNQKATAAAVEAARGSVAAARETAKQAQSRLAQAQAGLEAAGTRPQQISVQRSRADAARAQAQKSSAALEQARLNLQYTTIVASVSGIVGQRSVQPGQNVSPGQQLMTIVPLDNIWVTANFKETQLKHMRPGQRVKISVDTYGREYDGRVESIAGASGARFSLMPPENATGNYVKVVQRIPVKIVFDKGQDPEHLLRPGMSVVPRVLVK